VNTTPFCASTQALFPGTKCGQDTWVSTKLRSVKIKIISSSQIKMNYLHWHCHLSFLDVSPQIIPAKKPWETRLNFPAVSSGWREVLSKKKIRKRTRYDTHLSDRDSFLCNNFSPTKLLARNKLRYSAPFFWKNKGQNKGSSELDK